MDLQFPKEIDLSRYQPSTPGNSQAESNPEAAVKTANTVPKKTKAYGKDVHLALRGLRKTPTQRQDTSPVLLKHTRTQLHVPIAFTCIHIHVLRWN